VHEAESDLLKRDKHLTLIEACKHQSLKHIVNINCWQGMVWDKALDSGYEGTIAIQKLIRYLAIPMAGVKTALDLSTQTSHMQNI